jgi:hypothetical protein
MLSYLQGLVRHGLTTFGGYFMASADDLNALLAAGAALVGIVWSLIDKYVAAKAPK